MFTGIIEELGEVVAVEPLPGAARLRLRGPLVTATAAPGESIAVDGVCLTVVDVAGGEFTADVMAPTLDRSTLGRRRPGDRVNLERALGVAGRFGGHVVQGHVDGVGSVVSRTPAEHWEEVEVAVPEHLRRYVAAQGSVAVDGVSLTIAALTPGGFRVGLIPTTLAATTLGDRAVGEQVNLEVDVLAKYVERLLGERVAPA